MSANASETQLFLGKPRELAHPVKYYCVDCDAPLRSHGKSKKWREQKEKRCHRCAIRRTRSLKPKMPGPSQTCPEVPKVEITRKTRVIIKHINDGKVLQRQINELDSRVTVLEHDLPRKTVGEREIDVPDHLYKSYHALKAVGGKATAKEVCVRSGRARAAESSDLNVLVTLGFVNKFRCGRNVVFELKSLECAQA